MADYPTDEEARDAIQQMLGKDERVIEEPPIENRAPADKAISDYTPEEVAASEESLVRALRKRQEQDERERQEAAERQRAENALTDDQRIGLAITDSAQPGAKAARNAAFIRSIHGSEEA